MIKVLNEYQDEEVIYSLKGHFATMARGQMFVFSDNASLVPEHIMIKTHDNHVINLSDVLRGDFDEQYDLFEESKEWENVGHLIEVYGKLSLSFEENKITQRIKRK